MKRIDADNKYKWNLENIFKDEQDFKQYVERYISKQLELLEYKNKLNNKDLFKKFIFHSQEVDEIGEKIDYFLNLLNVEQNNQYLQKLESYYYNKTNDLYSKFSWIEEEIKNIGKDIIFEWIKNDKDLESFNKVYKDFFKNIKYLIPENQRKLISKISNSSSIIYEMYEVLKYKDNFTKKFEFNGKKYIADHKTVNKLMIHSDPIKDQELRAKISYEYLENNRTKKYSYAKLFESLLKEEIETCKLVGMNSFKENFFDEEHVSEKSFLNLIDIASENSDLYYKYHLLIKNYFSFKEKFYSTDSFLLLKNIEKKEIVVNEGIKLIKKSLSCLGKDYLENLNLFLNNNKIDFFEDEHKSDGAFTINNYLYDSLVSLNYTDDIESVFTLTHELGHAVHNKFAKDNQKRPLNSFSNLVAEVASTLNEHLLFEYLINNTEDINFKIYLIQNRIEFIFNNFFSALYDAYFEYKAYEYVEQNNKLNLEDIVKLLKESKEKVFKKNIFDSYDKNINEYNWISISHIFEQPFYIYKYAISIAVSFKLYQNFLETKNPLEIINFLKDGGSLYSKELFLKYGFDFENKKSFNPIIKHLEDLINELQRLINI